MQEPLQKKSANTVVCEISLEGETLQLHPHAAVFWPRKSTLILADLHLGKATHFRRNGLAVPDYVLEETLEKLSGLLLDFKPERVLILGDLFHADYNQEWEEFADLVLGFKEICFELVPGNHDSLGHHQYEKYGITVKPEPYYEAPFLFSHHPSEEIQQEEGSTTDGYNLAGHVHPAVRLKGKGNRLRLPCFYFSNRAGLLPAFGSFTGTYTISPDKESRVFVLAGEHVLPVSR